jgi:hypothetical protein
MRARLAAAMRPDVVNPDLDGLYVQSTGGFI